MGEGSHEGAEGSCEASPNNLFYFFPENRSMRLGFVQSRSMCKKIPVYRNPKNESLQSKTCQIDEKNGQNR